MSSPAPATPPAITPAPAPAPDPPSLVQRITALEGQLQRVFTMMQRDREYMDEILSRIGLTP